MSTLQTSWLAWALSFGGFAALAFAMERHYRQLTERDDVPVAQRWVLRGAGTSLLVAAFMVCLQTWGSSVGTVVALGFWSLGALMAAGLLAILPRVMAFLAVVTSLLAALSWGAVSAGWVL